MGDDDDDRTQRLVAELAEVRRRMSRRAIPVAAKARADTSEPSARLSTPPATRGATGAPPRPALGGKVPTQRIIVEVPSMDEPPAPSQRPPKR